jgi:adenine-specific DNA methylase
MTRRHTRTSSRHLKPRKWNVYASSRSSSSRTQRPLVLWENTTNEDVLNQARAEIWKSWRATCADNQDHPRAAELFNPDKLPAFHDPFAGGGALPLEAQRLGLEAYASDLNPVAVLINKAMIEIPPKFAGQPPVNPGSRREEIGSRREEDDALQGIDRVAEGDGGGARDIPSGAAVARELAYHLYTVCERRKRAQEALAYNGLVQSWPEIARLSREKGSSVVQQATLFE